LRREGVAVPPQFDVLLALQQSPEPACELAMVPTLAEGPEERVATAPALVRSEPVFRQMLEQPASPP